MYKQINGVSNSSPLRQTMANIFVGFHEAVLISNQNRPEVYFCYMDDIFGVFRNEAEANNLFALLNTIHPALKFTLE